MRKDENGDPCPATLGEYRDLVQALATDDNNPAVAFLDKKIGESPNGRDEVVVVEDSQMRMLLFPMLLRGLQT